MAGSTSETSATTLVAMGTIATVAGLLIVGVAARWLPMEESAFQAPHWVVGVAGLTFLEMGLYVLYMGFENMRDPESQRRLNRPGAFNVGTWLMGSLVLTQFAAVGWWVAFGRGERQFSGGVGGLGIGVHGATGEGMGRIMFGVFAVIVALLAAWSWIYGVRKLARTFLGRDPP